MKKTILNLLFLVFITVTLHTFLHNSYDHVHDSECSIYVLEQLLFGADTIGVFVLLTLFLPFTFFIFRVPTPLIQIQSHFNMRAPPSL